MTSSWLLLCGTAEGAFRPSIPLERGQTAVR
jgi:hypothetical protein